MTSKQLYIRLLKYALPYWKVLTTSTILLVLLAAMEPIFPALLKPLLDDGFGEKDKELIALIPAAIVLLFFAKGALSFTASYLNGWTSNHVVNDIRKDAYKRMLHLPTAFYDHHGAGELTARSIHHVGNMTTAATQTVVTLVRDSVTILGLLIWLLWADWKLTLLVFVMFPLIWIAIRYFNKRMRRFTKISQVSMERITNLAEESINNNRVVKIFNTENHEKQKMFSAIENFRKVTMKVLVAESALTPISQLIVAISISLILNLSLSQTDSYANSAGGFVAFLTALLLLLPPIKRLTDVSSVIQRGLAAAESVFSLIDEETESNTGKILLEPHKPRKIELKSINFSYPTKESLALKNITLSISPGETIALVGASGSGKSTIASLLTKLYAPPPGAIFIDDIDITELSIQSLRSEISVITQETRLFNETIFYNVTYGDQEPDVEKANEALRLAHATEFTSKLANGIQEQVGPNGSRLSGGQRQRLAIARTFYRDPSLLILDEATSALDNESEALVQESLRTLFKNRTSIVIAHRLSTIRDADRIVVMQDGQIAEIGTHEELIHAKGPYHTLYSLSSAGNKNFL